jgi:hypothetical protein
MPITPADLEPLVDSDEFKALSPQDRGTVLNGALREAHQYVAQNGGWTPERFKDFGTVAAGLRETALSESVGEHVGGALSTMGNVIKDSVATMATAAAAAVMPEDMPFGMSTVGAALGTNMQKLGKSVQSLYTTSDDILGNELQVLKHEIDAGQVPADGRGWSDWLDQRNDRMKQAQTKAYTSLEGDTPENRAFAESNSLLGNPRHGALLLDYLQTRDPAVWDELRKNVSMTPGRAKLEKQQDRIAKDTNLAKAMNAVFGEGAGNYIIEAGDPLEIAGNLLPMFKGAKVVKAIKGGSKLKAVGEAIVGAAGETASELGSQFMDDPNASWNQRLQVAKDAFIGALGLGGLGAGAQMVKDRFSPAAAVQDTAADPTKPPMRKPSDDLPPQRWTPRGQTMADMPEGAELTYDAQGQVTGWRMPAVRKPSDDLPPARSATLAWKPEEIAQSKQAFTDFIQDRASADALYDSLPESKGGKVISTDTARSLNADYAAPITPGQLRPYEVTDGPAAQYMNDRLNRELENRGERQTFVITSGGWGAGKSHALGQQFDDADLVLDGTASNPDWTRKLIQKALDNGWNVVMAHVSRPMDLVGSGVMERAMKEGRAVPVAKAPAVHRASQATAVQMAREFGDKVQSYFFHNPGTKERPQPVQELTLDDVSAGGNYHLDEREESNQQREALDAARRYSASNGVSDAIQAASGLGGETDGSVRPQPGQRPAGNPSQGSLERALQHIAGDRGTNGSQRPATGSDGPGRAQTEAQQLADAAGVPLMTDKDLAGLKDIGGGNEHDVFVDPKNTGRVVKVTLHNFGLRAGVRVPEGTIQRYLQRWQLSNRALGDNARLVGVMHDDKGTRLVISQPHAKPLDKANPHPTVDEVNRWLTAAGFEYQSDAWVRAADGVYITDVHPGNFIKTANGIRPIDVVVERDPQAQGPVIPWVETQQRLRAEGLESAPESKTSKDFNLDADNQGNGGPGASSLKEWEKTTFGQRLKSDERLRASWRQNVGGSYRVESEAEWQQRANAFLDAEGPEAAFAVMTDPDSGLSDSDRVAIGLQLILYLDEQIKQTQIAGGDISVLDDLLYEAAEWIEQRGTKLGQAVRVFGMWTRMSAEGVLRAFERKVHAARETHVSLNLGQDPAKIADEVSATAAEERSDVAAEALGDTTADQLAELQRQVAELRQQLAQATQEASAAQQDLAQATTPADAAQAQKRAQGAEKRRQRAQRDLANAEARQQRKAAAAGKPRPPGQKKAKPLNPDELAARLIARLSRLPGQQTQRTKNQVHQLAEDYAAGRIDGPTLQSSLQALGVTPAQAATLQQLLDVKAAAKTTPETPGQKRQPSNLSRQAFDWIERLTFRHVFGGPPAPQTTSALSQLIRDYLKAPDAASLPDFNGQARALGLPPAEAVELQRLLDLERKAHAEIAHERAINRLISQLTPKLSTAKTRERMPRFLKKLLEAHELGTLDRPEFLKAYAEAFDLPVMDAATRQRIKALIDAQKAAPEGFLKQEATTKLMGELALFKGIPGLDIFTAFWYANVLSGLTTQGVNVWGNAMHLALKTLTVGATHNPRETWHFIRGLYEGAKRGKLEAINSLKTGNVPYKGDLQFGSGQTLELIHTDNPQTWGERFKNGLSLGRFVFRALAAGDAFFYHTSKEARAWLEAARYADTQAKINGGNFGDYLAEQLQNGPTRYQQAIAQAQAELAGTAHASSYGHLDRRAWEIMEAARPQDLRAKAGRFGDLTTFTQEPEGFMGAVAGLINDAHKRFSLPSPWGPIRVLTPFIPFVNIVANITSTALDFTPVGILRGSTGRFSTHLLDRSKVDFDPWEARQRIASGILGTLGAALSFGWALALRDRDDDETPFMIYGMGPGTKARRDQMPKGWRPFTIKLGDSYISYAETPLSLVLAVAGNALDYLRYTPKGKEEHALGATAYALSTSPQALLKTGVLSSINDLFNLLEGQRSATQVMTRTASGFIPGQGLLRDISELFHGDKVDDITLAAALLKDVPILREIAGKPPLNVFGEPVQLDTLQRLPIFKRMVTGQGEDPQTLWLARQKLWLPGMDNQIDLGTYLGENDKQLLKGRAWREAREQQLGRAAADVLTAEERYSLVKQAGPGIRQAVKEMQAIKEQFPEATTQQLQERLNAKVVAQRRLAMRKVLGLR